jgi:hypothetical protein
MLGNANLAFASFFICLIITDGFKLNRFFQFGHREISKFLVIGITLFSFFSLHFLVIGNDSFIMFLTIEKISVFFYHMFIILLFIGGLIHIFHQDVAFADSLSDQLKDLQSVQITSTKSRIESEESNLMTKELQYPPGKLVARGIIYLSPEDLKDLKTNPYGLSDPTLIDAAFANDDASLIVLGVGREGPPLAAKRYSLKSITFPLVMELTSDDLLFPYTEKAWAESSNYAGTKTLFQYPAYNHSIMTYTGFVFFRHGSAICNFIHG